MRLNFAYVLLVSLSVLAALPPGITPNWSLDTAWKRSSEHAEEICLNGLWEFRGEPRLSVQENVTSYYQDDIEPNTINRWNVSTSKGVSFKKSFDTSEKTVGTGSLKLEMEVAPSTNVYQLDYFVQGLPVATKLEFSVDVKGDFVGNPINCEIQDARHWQYMCSGSSSVVSNKQWQTLKVDIVLPPECTKIRVILPRSQAGGIKGTLWIDNVRIVKREILPMKFIALPQNVKWGHSLVPGNWLNKDTMFWDESDTFRDTPKELRYAWFKRTVTIPQTWNGRKVFLRFERIATDAIICCNGEAAGTVPFDGGTVDITRWAKPGATLEIAALIEARLPWEVLPGFNTRPKEAWKQARSTGGISGDVFIASTVQNQKSLGLGNLQIITTVHDHVITVKAPLKKPASENYTWNLQIHDMNGVPAASFTGKLAQGAKAVTASAVWEDVKLWDIDAPNLYTATLTLTDAQGTTTDESLPERFGFRDFVIRGKFFYLNDIKLNFNPCAYWSSGRNWDTPAAMKHWLTNARGAGYNFVYMEDNDKPAQMMASRYLARLCDEMGMLCAITPHSINRGSQQYLKKDETRALWESTVEKTVRSLINHPSIVLWRMNMNMNCYAQDQNPLLLDGKKPFAEGSASQRNEDSMLFTNAFVRSIDPTRHTYNHACGKSGEIYTLNNYLGWPELQDLREWLKVWSENGDKPLFMVENAIPYPGDFQMRDPTRWWKNEPLMTEYGAILLGDRAYDLEDTKYVDYIPTVWSANSRSWNQSYGYFCGNYPPILDECTVMTYSVMYPYWRTWGISGAMNTWENGWRRKIKTTQKGVYGLLPPAPKSTIDWTSVNQPGRHASGWGYDPGPGGEMRMFFDRGTADEIEYFEDTHRAIAFKKLMKRTFAWIAGPTDRWYTVEHAFRSGETVSKTLILLNDSRSPQTFAVSWKAAINNAVIAASDGVSNVTVAPGEQARLPFSFTVPSVVGKTQACITASVTVGDDDLTPESFPLQFFPPLSVTAKDSQPATVGMLDPTGKSMVAFAKIGLKPQRLNPEQPLPETIATLFIGCNALDSIATAPVFANLTERVRNGLHVIILEQSEKALKDVFGFRCFTPGIRTAWCRFGKTSPLKNLDSLDFTNWRAATTLGPLDGVPESLDMSQRWKRVWRCSQEGVIASTVIEKPHHNVLIPLLDTGFDLRYTPLASSVLGQGTITFCQLDVSDRLGIDPTADSVIQTLWDSPAVLAADNHRTVMHIGGSPAFAAFPPIDLAKASSAVFVLSRGCRDWLASHRESLLACTNARILAVGLTADELQLLSTSQNKTHFTVGTGVNWMNSVSSDQLSTAFQGISAGDLRWRKKLTTAVMTSVGDSQSRLFCGTFALISLPGNSTLCWYAALPEDFKSEERDDLVFSQVKTERLIHLLITNLGATGSTVYTDSLGPKATTPKETNLYSDQRVPRDDPYADMRW